MNKSFSVFNNYEVKPHCDSCGKESNVFIVTVYGRLCDECKKTKREEEIKKRM